MTEEKLQKLFKHLKQFTKENPLEVIYTDGEGYTREYYLYKFKFRKISNKLIYIDHTYRVPKHNTEDNSEESLEDFLEDNIPVNFQSWEEYMFVKGLK